MSPKIRYDGYCMKFYGTKQSLRGAVGRLAGWSKQVAWKDNRLNQSSK